MVLELIYDALELGLKLSEDLLTWEDRLLARAPGVIRLLTLELATLIRVWFYSNVSQLRHFNTFK